MNVDKFGWINDVSPIICMYLYVNHTLIKITSYPILLEGPIQHQGAKIEFLCKILMGPCHLTPLTRCYVVLFYKNDLIYATSDLYIGYFKI